MENKAIFVIKERAIGKRVEFLHRGHDSSLYIPQTPSMSQPNNIYIGINISFFGVI